MGNHEYCSGCGASDFHSGMSCAEAYPKRWAEKEAERKAKQIIEDKETTRVNKLVNATVSGGKRAIVARLLAIRVAEEALNKKLRAIKEQIDKINSEERALSKHCPHPKKYVEGGFMYTSCNLCYESDI